MHMYGEIMATISLMISGGEILWLAKFGYLNILKPDEKAIASF